MAYKHAPMRFCLFTLISFLLISILHDSSSFFPGVVKKTEHNRNTAMVSFMTLCRTLPTESERVYWGEWESRLEIRVAWITPPSAVPLQITKSPSLTWLASMSLTFLSP